VYDKILDDNMFCESVIDGWIKSGGMLEAKVLLSLRPFLFLYYLA
jgi:hypothetical protein